MLDSCRAMENEGFSVTYLPVQQNGVIDMKVHSKANSQVVNLPKCFRNWRPLFDLTHLLSPSCL